MISILDLSNKLFAEKSVAIFCHVRPDGDCLGCAFAIQRAFLSRNIVADVFCEDDLPERFSFLIDKKELNHQITKDYSCFLAVDCADISRLGVFGDAFIKHKNTFCIDHHISNTRFAKENFVLDTAANAQNIFELLKSAKVKIDDVSANLLAMGIMTDTGGFRHKNTDASCLKTVSRLVELGADLNKISFYMFTAQSKARARLFGLVMSNIKYYNQDRVAVAVISQNDLKTTCATPDETEGFIDFIMGIEGVEVACCLLEMEKDKYKISLRSRKTDVNGVAQTFGGGGHTLAAGCKINGVIEEVLDKLIFAVSRYLPE